MNINCAYPQKISWRIDISNYKDSLNPFSDKTRKRISKAKKLLDEQGYMIRCEDLSEKLINQFVYIYNHHIGKLGGLVHDVKEKIFNNPPHKFPYKFFNIYHKEIYVGGLIFSDRGDHLVVAYKAIPHRLNIKIPISLSYIAETYLYKYALDNNKMYIRRGSDRNLYGIELSIGLALYKLQIGNYPILVPDKKLTIINCFDWKEEDTLVFLAPQVGNKIDQAMMYSTKPVDELHDTYHLLFTNKNLTVNITNPNG